MEAGGLERPDWADTCRDAFLAAYRETIPGGGPTDTAMLAALELDKALYEVCLLYTSRCV